MQNYQLRPSIHSITQISELERFAGRWDKLSETLGKAEELSENAMRAGAESSLILDHNAPVGLFGIDKGTSALEDQALRKSVVNQEIAALLGLLKSPLELSLDGLGRAQRRISDSNNQKSSPYSRPAHFSTPKHQRIFSVVPAFLIEQRLSELIKWTETELTNTRIPPLFIIGSFHLLFLQIQPFAFGNHRLCLSIVWHLLINNSYPFLKFAHFADYLRENENQYVNALRQAERTAHRDWSSLPLWLEFFLNSLLDCKSRVEKHEKSMLLNYRLSPLQKRMIEVVRSHGAASRDLLVKETGAKTSTIKYNLNLLAKSGQLTRRGGGRSTVYTIL